MQHQPKRIVLTKREGSEVAVALFTESSTREQEVLAFDLAKDEGWMCHIFKPGNVGAIHEALDRHHEIEQYNREKLEFPHP